MLQFISKFSTFAERYLGIPHLDLPRLARTVSIAGLFSGLNVLSYAVASSLFVDRIGSTGLPFSYILVGLVASPLYFWFSKIADQQSRPQLARSILLVTAVTFVILRLLLTADVTLTYYVIYILAYFQWTLQLDVVLPSLISDYYTSREYNRYTHFITMAQALGGLMGGAIVGLLAERLGSSNLLLLVPPLAMLILWRVMDLETHEQPIGSVVARSFTQPVNPEPRRISRRALWKEYPLIRLLATSVFLWIVLYSLAEYRYFDVYSSRYEGRLGELTAFLGRFSAVNSVVQFLALYFLTRKIVNDLGVRQSTLLYPFTTFLCFVGLSFSPSFPIAVATQINSATIETTLNQPIHTLFYNPIPQRIIGTVRTLCDGFSYSAGLVVVGVVLLVSQTLEAKASTTQLGVLLSLIYLGVRYLLSAEYFRTLVANLGSEDLDLDDVREGFASIPSEQLKVLIQQFQTGNDTQRQKILELIPSTKRMIAQVASQIEMVIPTANQSLRRSIVECWRQCGDRDPNLRLYLHDRLQAHEPTVQAVALQACLVRRDPLTEADLKPLFLRSHQAGDEVNRYQRLELDTLAHIAVDLLPTVSLELREQCEQFWQQLIQGQLAQGQEGEASTAIASRLEIAIQIICYQQTPELVARLYAVLETSQDADIISQVFTGLTEFAPRQPLDNRRELAQRVQIYLGHPDIRVRTNAVSLMGALAIPEDEYWEAVANCLLDQEVNVRLKASQALKDYGTFNLDRLEAEYLYKKSPDTVEVAITAIAQIDSVQAQKVLQRYLESEFEHASQLQHWLKQVPNKVVAWQPLQLALQDQSYQIFNRILLVLASWGDAKTKRLMRKVRLMLMDTYRQRERANAIEVLVSMTVYKEYIARLLPMLEFLHVAQTVNKRSQEADREFLAEVAQTDEPWIQMAVVLVCLEHDYPIPDRLTQKEQAHTFTLQILPGSGNNYKRKNVQRAFFLKTSSLFARLTLPDIGKVVSGFQPKFLEAGEILIAKGGLSPGLCVVEQGTLIAKPDVLISNGSHGLDGSIDPEEEDEDDQTIDLALDPSLTATSSATVDPYPSEVKIVAGQFFGGHILMGATLPAPMTIQATEPCTILLLMRENFTTINELLPVLSVYVSESCPDLDLLW